MSWPYLTDSKMSIRGTFKSRNEDFRVQEIPIYEPCGSGEHLYLYVEKSGVSTDELIRELSRKTNIPSRDIGYAGKKDRKSISCQWVSLWRGTDDVLESLQIPGVRILKSGYHKNKLRKGHLRGNQFEIVVRNPSPGANNVASDLLQVLEEVGVPNYFGPQRFGVLGDNAVTGADILQGERNRGLNRRFRFFLNALQSYWFNLSLAKRMPCINRIENGDLAYIHRNGAVFSVTDQEAEYKRARTFEISPSGPMWGDRMSLPAGLELKLESDVLREGGLEPEQLKAFFGRFRVRGERRPYRVRPNNTDYNVINDSLLLTFGLPAGSYATSVIRELLKDDLNEPEVLPPIFRNNHMEPR